jgi:hypothetical protein
MGMRHVEIDVWWTPATLPSNASSFTTTTAATTSGSTPPQGSEGLSSSEASSSAGAGDSEVGPDQLLVCIFCHSPIPLYPVSLIRRPRHSKARTSLRRVHHHSTWCDSCHAETTSTKAISMKIQFFIHDHEAVMSNLIIILIFLCG